MPFLSIRIPYLCCLHSKCYINVLHSFVLYKTLCICIITQLVKNRPLHFPTLWMVNEGLIALSSHKVGPVLPLFFEISLYCIGQTLKPQLVKPYLLPQASTENILHAAQLNRHSPTDQWTNYHCLKK